MTLYTHSIARPTRNASIGSITVPAMRDLRFAGRIVGRPSRAHGPGLSVSENNPAHAIESLSTVSADG